MPDIDGAPTDSVSLQRQARLKAMRTLDLASLATDRGGHPHHTDTGIFQHALAAHGLREIPGARALTEAAAASRRGVVYATGGIRGVGASKLRAAGLAHTTAS